MGTNKGKKNLFEVMGYIFDISKEKIKYKIAKYLGQNKKLFNTLNQGILSFKFKNRMFNFYNYISNENEENTLEWTLDLFSRPGMLHQKGLNIFVFSLNKDKEIILKPPKHLFPT